MVHSIIHQCVGWDDAQHFSAPFRWASLRQPNLRTENIRQSISKCLMLYVFNHINGRIYKLT